MILLLRTAVVPLASGHFSSCPCGVGVYELTASTLSWL